MVQQGFLKRTKYLWHLSFYIKQAEVEVTFFSGHIQSHPHSEEEE